MKWQLRVCTFFVFGLLLTSPVLTADQLSPPPPSVTVSTVEQKPVPKSQQQTQNIVTLPDQSQAPTISQPKIQTPTQPTVTPQADVVDESGVVDQGGEKVDFQVDPLEENLIQEEEKKLEEQDIASKEKQLHKWVAQEFDSFSEADQLPTHEIFAEEIYDELSFKWNPTEFKQGPLRFVVEVFNFNRGEVTLPDNPEEDDCVEVYSKSENQRKFKLLGKVYVKKMFVITFFTDYQEILLKNQYGKNMVIQLRLEATKFVPEKALADDKLKISAEKVKTILQQLEQTEIKRERTYQSEWNFRQRQEHHQSQMLMLTGVQLMIILGTAIVQMYCIKNLFDNRLIV